MSPQGIQVPTWQLFLGPTPIDTPNAPQFVQLYSLGWWLYPTDMDYTTSVTIGHILLLCIVVLPKNLIYNTAAKLKIQCYYIIFKMWYFLTARKVE